MLEPIPPKLEGNPPSLAEWRNVWRNERPPVKVDLAESLQRALKNLGSFEPIPPSFGGRERIWRTTANYTHLKVSRNMQTHSNKLTKRQLQTLLQGEGVRGRVRVEQALSAKSTGRVTHKQDVSREAIQTQKAIGNHRVFSFSEPASRSLAKRCA